MITYINIYRSGWFHRKGKPGTCDLHGGDCYPSYEKAIADIEPASHYVTTIAVDLEGVEVVENPSTSQPIPLRETRRQHV